MDTMISALNRIEGQVRGIRKMYQEGRDCGAIAQQISAVSSALRRVGKELLTTEAGKCFEDAPNKEKLSTIIDSLVKLG